MKILYITNSLPHQMANYLGMKRGPKGGWVHSIVKAMNETTNEIAVASLYSGKDFLIKKINDIQYYCIPSSNKMQYEKRLDKYWKYIKSEFEPDIVHIFGTEFPMTLSYVNSCGSENVVVSIQGLVSQIYKYCMAGISWTERVKSLTILSITRGLFHELSMYYIKSSFYKRAKWELEVLSKIRFIEGRTSWDRANVLSINPNLKYYTCNRTLRDSFYSHTKWSYEACEKHSIFVSQGRMPLKGLHKVIEALYIVKKRYGDVKLYVTNSLNLEKSVFYGFINETDYIHYLRRLIKKYNLQDSVISTGLLNEEAMANRMWKSNVFVSASSIENSPNSVAEAQILGVPCIGSYVGGTMDMIKEGETGYLYRFEEVSMLADLICKIFEMKEGVEVMSKQEIICATARHDKSQNIEKMLSIYKEIIETV